MIVEIAGVYGRGYDIKTTPGIIVILRDILDALQQIDNEGVGIVLDIMSITSGEHYGTIRLKLVHQDQIVFCEMFRHYALMKLQNQEVSIINLLTKEVIKSPPTLRVNIKAFLFFNEVGKFLILSEGGQAVLMFQDLKTHKILENIRPADDDDKQFTISTSTNKDKMLYPAMNNDILIYDLWSLNYLARIRVSDNIVELKAEKHLTILYDKEQARLKAIFLDQKFNQVLVSDDYKIIHRLGINGQSRKQLKTCNKRIQQFDDENDQEQDQFSNSQDLRSSMKKAMKNKGIFAYLNYWLDDLTTPSSCRKKPKKN